MNERIRKLRKTLGLTQQEFAEQIGVKRNTVATYEIGRNTPLDAVIASMCRVFHVSEQWLRTGEGGMFEELTQEEELAAFFGDLLSGGPDFRQRLLMVLARMKPEEWQMLEHLLAGLSEAAQ